MPVKFFDVNACLFSFPSRDLLLVLCPDNGKFDYVNLDIIPIV